MWYRSRYYKERRAYWDAVNPYDRPKFEEEQKMRNTIKVLDPDIVQPRLANIGVGEMFRYPKGSKLEENVYMRVLNGVVLLATGAVYSDFRTDAVVERVTSIMITKPL